VIIILNLNGLNQQSSTFVAPETGFLEVSCSSMDWDEDQAVMWSYGGDGTGSNMSNSAGGNASDGVARSRTRLSDWTELNWSDLAVTAAAALLSNFALLCFVFAVMTNI